MATMWDVNKNEFVAAVTDNKCPACGDELFVAGTSIHGGGERLDRVCENGHYISTGNVYCKSIHKFRHDTQWMWFQDSNGDYIGGICQLDRLIAMRYINGAVLPYQEA